MPTHRTDDNVPASAVKTSKPKTEAAGLQRRVLDLQRQAGNAATAATLEQAAATKLQRHALDPDNADE